MTRRVMWAGLAVVLAAAAILSFLALRDLAQAVGIPHLWCPLLPVAIDAGAAVSCAVWLTRGVPEDARSWAQGMTWTLLVLTVVGNAAELGMRAAALVVPWWVAVIVGAVPPAVVGSTVHLAVLFGRRSEPVPEVHSTRPNAPQAEAEVDSAGDVATVAPPGPPVEAPSPTPIDIEPATETIPTVRVAGQRDELVAMALRLKVAAHLVEPVVEDLAAGVGRPTLLKTYEPQGLTYHQAKELTTYRNRAAS